MQMVELSLLYFSTVYSKKAVSVRKFMIFWLYSIPNERLI